MTETKLIPDDIRLRMHADMDQIFELQEQNAKLGAENNRLLDEINQLKRNQRVRARPSPGGNDNAES